MTQKRKNVIFHIGYHKCGSTQLQRRFFRTHPEVDYISRDEYALTLINQNAFKRDLNLLVELVRSSTKSCVVFSCEELSGNFHNGGMNGSFPKLLLAELAQAFPHAKFITVIRAQVDLFRSLYSQYIKEGGSLPYRRYFSPNLREFKYRGPGFCREHFEYSHQIQFLHKIIGKDRINVCLFEDLVSSYSHFTDDLCEFMEVSSHPASDSAIENEALSAPTLRVFRSLNFFFEGDVFQGEKSHYFFNQGLINKRLRRLRVAKIFDRYLSYFFKSRLNFDTHFTNEIISFFERDNEKVEFLIDRSIRNYRYFKK